MIQLALQQALAGEIALATGDLAAADAAFGSAEFKITSFSIFPALATLVNNLPFRDGLARAAAARGDLRAAMEMYRRLNQPDITAKWTSVLEPRFVLAVGPARGSGRRSRDRPRRVHAIPGAVEGRRRRVARARRSTTAPEMNVRF